MSETSASPPSAPPAARPVKGAAAFRTIGEVAEDLDLPAHVLRFWESKFPQLKPLKRGGGRRYYRPEDIELLRRIRQCLYQDGYTIRGVQKLLGGAGGNGAAAADAAPPTLFPLDAGADAAAPPPTLREEAKPLRRPRPPRAAKTIDRSALGEIFRELLEARTLLNELTKPPKPTDE